MISSSLALADKLNEFFYEGLDRETSVCLYGSAATGNWVDSRSDLDLVILAPEEKLELLGRKIREWTWNRTLPILDGYVLSRYSSGSLSIKRLDEYARVTFPSDTTIELVDQWNIKNRSKHLYGEEVVTALFPDISNNELKHWATKHLQSMSAPNPDSILPEAKVKLSGLIWSVSWMARMLMLTDGIVCDSKRAALEWLASEHSEIEDLISLLLNDYSKFDEDQSILITPEQSAKLRRFCIGLLWGIKRPLTSSL